LTEEQARALDAADPLACFRERFVIDDDGGDRVYADGNSLGRLPRATVDRLRRVVEHEWGRELIGSWESWIDLPHRAGDLIGTRIVGARPGETVIADSTTVNLYKLACAAGRRTVVTDTGNFPTDRFVLQGLPGVRVELVPADPSPDDVAAALARCPGGETLVALSHVSYFSGARLDLPAITQVAHGAGALVLWDLSHSAGAVPVDLAANGVDLAVGCTYKYLNGGPGSPAFLNVRAGLQATLPQPIPGWFGARDPFAMQRAEYEPAPGMGRFVSGTPAVLGLAAVEEGAAIVAEAGTEALEAKGAALTSFLIECADAHLGGLGFEVITPREPARRGVHVSLRHPEAWRVCRALIEHLGVVPDFREPDVVRVGLAPLYSRFVDAWTVVQRLRAAVADRVYERMPAGRRRVT
jgi:kynureninase